MTTPLPFTYHLPWTDAAALAELYRRGTPDNTVRAWERDLACVTAWKQAAFGATLTWPEAESVALRFVLDHASDLGDDSGGRWRSEIVALNRDGIDDRDLTAKGILRIRLLTTKTTGPNAAPRLPLKGRAACAVMNWITAARIDSGPLFRPVSLADRPLPRRLSFDGLSVLLRHRLELAGYPPGFASAHGLRAGFLTQAALDGAPLQAAMQLSLHRSVNQAQQYYADIEIERNPATDLLED
ncbi:MULTISPECIES: hypothetical protein [unclassified Paracoccus (in: a-proteobacteria)]|uniref:hypothetical protein n=1 Tax=unclassified Paracoccus (in: a-proteobacteria) TaxID=2688777 RepID=UPI001FFE2AB0|nr:MULTISPECIES: hypothetical protein [unclassified Paracoccus (in: a-proteobacteria)]